MNLFGKPKTSLQLKLTLYFLSIAFFPFAFFAIHTYLRSAQAFRVQYLEGRNLAASAVGANIEEKFFDVFTHMKALAENPVLRADPMDREEALKTMQRRHRLITAVSDVTLLDAEGRVLLSTAYEYEGDLKKKEWFKKAAAGHAVISPVHALLRPFRLVVVVAVPVVRMNGELRGVLTGTVDMTTVWVITDRVQLGHTGFVALVDPWGNFIAHPEKEKLFQKVKPDTLRKQLLAEENGIVRFSQGGAVKECYFLTLRGYELYPGQGWRLLFVQNEEEIYKVLYEARRRVIMGGVFGFFVILVLSNYLGYSTAKPVKMLIGGVRKINAGDLRARVRIRSKDEIGALGEAFNKMAKDLEATTLSRNYVEHIFSSMMNVLIVTDAKGLIQTTNDAAQVLLGYREKELIGLGIKTIFAESSPFSRWGYEALSQQEVLSGAEEAFLSKEGESIPVLLSSTVLRDERGKVQGVVCAAQDMRRLRRAEAARMETEEKFESITAAAIDAILVMDADGIISYWNHAAEKIFGYTRKEALGKDLHLFLAPQRFHEAQRKAFPAFQATGQGPVIGKVLELAAVRKDGTEFPIELSVSAVQLEGKWGAIGILRDITERKKAQEQLQKTYSDLMAAHEQLKTTQLQLIQAAKMDSVGRLAAGVAHEVKNPLAIIQLGLDYLSKSEPLKEGKMASTIGEIGEAVKKADIILKELLNFSAPRTLELTPQNLNALFENALFLVKHDLAKNRIHVEKSLSEHLPELKLDGNKIGQVFVNLFLNAIQAMPQGGTLTVRTHSERLANAGEGVGRRATDPFKVGDPVIVAEVEDTGGGILEELLPKVFDPFFTTKPVGKGTGLGLTVTQKIIEMHGGFITVCNRKEGGVRATVVFKA
ncbi:MAG: PAS domain S-box protein [Candidatus Omnitrophota bacterium]